MFEKIIVWWNKQEKYTKAIISITTILAVLISGTRFLISNYEYYFGKKVDFSMERARIGIIKHNQSFIDTAFIEIFGRINNLTNESIIINSHRFEILLKNEWKPLYMRPLFYGDQDIVTPRNRAPQKFDHSSRKQLVNIRRIEPMNFDTGYIMLYNLELNLSDIETPIYKERKRRWTLRYSYKDIRGKRNSTLFYIYPVPWNKFPYLD